MLLKLDNYATDIFVASSLKRNSYKTISELITLCCLTLLRDILRPFDVLTPQSEISEKFAKEVRFCICNLAQIAA